ncbi:acyltransferase [Thiomicrorhabdus immobilis]|uniref:Acyltransferase n=1 Tax=Thiomicrorhabdus immobilis TaxID=2791037 RepID=A0ABM7MES5_9GAMM|nr:acyltransferase [Thiomicrorhabdus immobilis]BCN93924.1 acyltransferase [Thiomicrorhabdus immobilis]
MSNLANLTTHFAQLLVTIMLWPFKKPYLIAQDIIHQPGKAFPVVDFLKGLSVLMVILFHIFFAVFFLFKKDPEKLQLFVDSIPAWFSFILAFDKAVDIFFMLSSFLLSYALLKVYDKKQSIHIGRFYLHRFFRIYPLFLVALLLYGLADINKLLQDGWYSLLFIENIYSKGIIPVQWSLSIEMQFYLILPFLLLFLAKSKRPILWLTVLIILSIGLRFVLALQSPVIYQTHWYDFLDSAKGKIYMDTMYYVIESRITPLLLGMLWAIILWRYPLAQLNFSKIKLAIFWTFGLAIIYLSMRFPIYYQDSVYFQNFNETLNLFVVSLHRIVFSMAILGLVLLAHYQIRNPHQDLLQKFNHALVNFKGWRLLSEVAYPMYFFHFPFIVLAWAIVLGTVKAEQVQTIPLYLIPLAYVLAVLFTLYLSLWLNFLVEARFIRIGKQIETKWFGGHNASTTPNNNHSK